MVAQICFSSLILALLLVVAYGGTAAVKFGYYGAVGPEKWGSLSPTYSECSKGKSQSPINIIKNDTVLDSNLKPLIRDYEIANATLVNNVCNIGVHFDNGCGALIIDGKNYKLIQLHWHSPSEHQINGVHYPLELHLVHLAEDGARSVVAVLYKYGPENPFIAKIHNGLGKLAKNEYGNGHVPLEQLDVKPLKKKTSKYFRYIGSLTTPPCTENVIWNVLGKARTVSKEQVEALKAPLEKAYKHNNRPVQPLNGRKVSLYKET
ncbi:hypothetical protein JCGZ_06755 [Jatropha curcas]|uniref:Carbonic anhydrase n=1 Tax=Jatropha curcas TaxID=180498 RepID=A0A067KM47_JATCU|nr:hypothetical protein JCGZ_06755 [Jatropha curcas]